MYRYIFIYLGEANKLRSQGGGAGEGSYASRLDTPDGQGA